MLYWGVGRTEEEGDSEGGTQYVTNVIRESHDWVV